MVTHECLGECEECGNLLADHLDLLERAGRLLERATGYNGDLWELERNGLLKEIGDLLIDRASNAAP
jgi:hypothetical protein